MYARHVSARTDVPESLVVSPIVPFRVLHHGVGEPNPYPMTPTSRLEEGIRQGAPEG